MKMRVDDQSIDDHRYVVRISQGMFTVAAGEYRM
jgi:hypothetical protein